MSRLNVALVIGALILMAGASDAQAARIRLPLFDLFGVGTPHVLVLDPGRNAPVVDFGDQGNGNGNGNKPSIAPDDSRSLPDWTTHYADNGDWSANGSDKPDTGDWQQTTVSQDTPQWTMQTVTRDDP